MGGYPGGRAPSSPGYPMPMLFVSRLIKAAPVTTTRPQAGAFGSLACRFTAALPRYAGHAPPG